MGEDVLTFDELDALIANDLVPLARSLKFDAQSWNDIVPITLFCALLEGASAAILLGRAGYKMQAYVVLRSMLEGAIELELVSNEQDRVLDFRLRSEANLLNTLKRANEGNPYFESIGALPDLSQLIEIQENKIQQIKDAGGTQTSIRNRFELVGAQAEYEGLYHKLSGETHTSLSALMARFVDVKNDRLSVRAFHNDGEKEFDALVGSLQDLLTRARETISKRFPVPAS